MLLGIFLVSYELFIEFHSPVGHFSECQMAAVVVTVFCCIVLHLPAGLEQIPLYFRELDGEGQGPAGRGLSSLEMQIIQVIVLIHLLL